MAAHSHTPVDLPSWPSGLRRGLAAGYVGCSVNYFYQMVREGVLPPGRRMGGVRVWLRPELDIALAELPADLDGVDPADGADDIDRMIEGI